MDKAKHTPRTTRTERGLALYHDRGEEIAHVAGTVWSVPSCSTGNPGVYLVDVESGVCTCPDRPQRSSGEVCKHATAAEIVRSKTAACSGCGVRRRRRELVELVEDNHDNLTWFHGDRLCTGCADRSGVMR